MFLHSNSMKLSSEVSGIRYVCMHVHVCMCVCVKNELRHKLLNSILSDNARKARKSQIIMSYLCDFSLCERDPKSLG